MVWYFLVWFCFVSYGVSYYVMDCRCCHVRRFVPKRYLVQQYSTVASITVLLVCVTIRFIKLATEYTDHNMQ